jgi:hypothetical protein
MNLQSIFVFQIIADFIFCLILFFLLARLRKFVDQSRPPAIDPELFSKFQDVMSQSRSASEKFLDSLDESCRRLNELAVSLESRANHLTAVLKEADAKIELVAVKRDYNTIADYLQDGLSAEEVAGRTGLPLGEVMLIVDLERLKKKEEPSS